MKSIYIVLTDSGTLFTRFIKLFTNCPYNHASIALDPELSTIYSFGRKSLYFPLNAGFVKERKNTGIYKKLRNTTCIVYELPISEEQYERVVQEIEKFDQESHRYTYNLIGLISFLLPFRIRRRSAFFCSEFVATVLQNSGVDILPKPPSLTAPHDFMRLQQVRRVYEGFLNTH